VGGREGVRGGERQRDRETERETHTNTHTHTHTHTEREPDISRHSCPSLAMISDAFSVGSASLIFSRSWLLKSMYAKR
jgi:hypothetical protein